jgi:hypothetical protein
MSALSNYMAKNVMDMIFNKTAFTPPEDLYFALYTTDPGADNSGIEVTGGGYARTKIPGMTAAELIDGKMTVKNSGNVEMPRAASDWTQANYWAILDAPQSGNLIVRGALTTPVTIKADQQPVFDIGDLVITSE